MSYFDRVLEPGDSYINRYSGVRLPCDSVLDDPDALKELSGPVIPRRLEDLEREVKSNDQTGSNRQNQRCD